MPETDGKFDLSGIVLEDFGNLDDGGNRIPPEEFALLFGEPLTPVLPADLVAGRAGAREEDRRERKMNNYYAASILEATVVIGYQPSNVHGFPKPALLKGMLEQNYGKAATIDGRIFLLSESVQPQQAEQQRGSGVELIPTRFRGTYIFGNTKQSSLADYIATTDQPAIQCKDGAYFPHILLLHGFADELATLKSMVERTIGKSGGKGKYFVATVPTR